MPAMAMAMAMAIAMAVETTTPPPAVLPPRDRIAKILPPAPRDPTMAGMQAIAV